VARAVPVATPPQQKRGFFGRLFGGRRNPTPAPIPNPTPSRRPRGF